MENNKQGAIVKKESEAIIKFSEPAKVLIAPLVDLYDTADGFILKLDIPGAEKDSIRLTIENGRLEIQASVNYQQNQDSKLIYSEIGSKIYLRNFRLSDGIDLDNISAQYENGVLTITLPKTEEIKAKEIKIN